MALTHDDYTIAWICALPLEMTAAKAMLDETHPALPPRKSDHNVYTLGSVGGHNVVVACLPAGVYGTISAAIVVSHLRSTYPNIQFGLMVGIGGGVPSEVADIRLGDLVVSKPTAVSSGVIQYDYGKTLRDGRFQRTGSLNKPPPVLLKAVAQIESDLKAGKGRLNTTIFGVLKNDGMKGEFSRPTTDWLFKSTYNHNEGNPNCSTCDLSQLVDRPTRATEEPYVHYGLIASGDQVIKDARTRDSIARDLDILCFEMEAAGMMDELPSIVIRGISDYCDSHKHKAWQGYAALSAAAYAKLLLSVVPATVNKPSTQGSTFTPEEEKECLHALFLTDPADDKNALKRRKGDRAPGTCSWILQTPELNSWLGNHEDNSQEESNILWLYGNPGTGKSTMAITMTDELPAQPCFVDGRKILAYFFCDSSSEVNRTATAVLRGLLYQLIRQRPTLMRPLLSRYAERKGELFSSFDALWGVLMEIGKCCNNLQIYCIIDALDECEPDSQKILLDQIDQTFNNWNSQCPYRPSTHFLITSRPYYELRQSLGSFRCKDLATYEAVADDLRTVIQQRVEIMSKRNTYPTSVIAEVSRILEEKAEGTFLWVGLACEQLAQEQSRNAVNTLQALPRGLDSLYHKLLNAAIAASSEHDEQIIMEILSFVAFAVRPLSLLELSDACKLYPDEEEESRLRFTRDCVDSCRLMVVVQGIHVRLLHQSVKDFLANVSRKIDSMEANAAITYRCIDNILRNHKLMTYGGPIDPYLKFLGYAVLYWPEHASRSGTKFVVLPEYEGFFLAGSRSWDRWRRYYHVLQRHHYVLQRHHHDEMHRRVPEKLDFGFSTLHAAARWGIPQLIHFAVHGANSNYDNAKATRERTLLVDSNFRTARGVTPLAEAATSGRVDMMRILLQNGPPDQQIQADVINAARLSVYQQVFPFILDYCSDQVQITEGMIKAVAANRWRGESMRWRKDQFHDDTQHISAIIRHFDGENMVFLLDQWKNRIEITEDIIKAAAKNRWHRESIITLLLKRYKDQFHDNRRLIPTIIQYFGKPVIVFLLDLWKNRVEITEDIITAAARNPSHEILPLLLERCKDQVQGNTQLISAVIQGFNRTVVTVFLRCCGDNVQITEDHFKAAARNYEDEDVMTPVLEQYADQIRITEEKGLGANDLKDKARQACVAETRLSEVKALVGYWRGINREDGERYWYVPWYLRNPNFKPGDHDIAKLETSITQQAGPVRIAIRGQSVFDRTNLLIELAYRARERDSANSIFWIWGARHEMVEQGYMNLANILGFYDANPAEAKNRVKDYLSQEKAGKWLLIFNDADDIDMWNKGSARAPQLMDFLPESAKGCILLATGDADLAAQLSPTDLVFLS